MRLAMVVFSLVSSLFIAIAVPAEGFAKEFEIFDGRVYNGKYYPRIDIIEWGQPSNMEFHVYSKDKPIEMSFELERQGNRKIMLVHYHIKDRDERLCRRVLAPGHFSEEFFVYKDTSDKDFDNTIVSMQQLPPKVGRTLVNPPKYVSCEMSEKKRMPASSDTPNPQHHPERVKHGAIGVGRAGTSPFADW